MVRRLIITTLLVLTSTSLFAAEKATAASKQPPGTVEAQLYDDGDCMVPSGCAAWPDDPNSTSYKPPSATTCTAKKSLGQRCRTCAAQYANDGQPTGITVCAYVDENAECSCSFEGKTCSRTSTSCTYTWFN